MVLPFRGARPSIAVAVTLSALLLGAAPPAEIPDPLIAEAVGKKAYVLAEFVSRSCPVCREMKPVVEAAVARHRKIIHQTHDADADMELADKYKVRCVPVYVIVDPSGKVRFNDVGTRTAAELDEILRKAGVKRR